MGRELPASSGRFRNEPELRLDGFLVGAEEVCLGFGTLIQGGQISLHAQEEMCRHAGIRQSPMVTTIDGNVVQINESGEFVIDGPGVKTAGNQDRAEELVLMRQTDSRQLVLPEFAIETGVVGNEGGITDKLGNFGHDALRGGSRSNHGGRDAGQRGDEARHTHTGVHQALPGVDNLAVLQEDGGDFQSTAALIRHEAVGFKIEDGVASHATAAYAD